MTKAIVIKGVGYLAVESLTPSAMQAKGRPNIAKMMRDNKVISTHYAQKLNGKVIYQIDEHEGGIYGKPFKVA